MPPARSMADDPAAGVSDEELARRAQAGSSACFGRLVRRHEGRLLRFLMQRAGQVADAEDLLQETFARAYERIGTYKPAWKFTTWVFTIASRLAASQYRKRRPPLVPWGRPAAGGPDPAAVAARREEKENLWALAAEALPADQHTALWLRYAEAMSVKEISRVMGKTRTHVKVMLFRARGALGARLTEADARPGRDAPSPRPSRVAGTAKGR